MKLRLFCLLTVLILSSCGDGGQDESLSAANIDEVLRELDISGNVSPEMEKFVRCLVSGPAVSLWDRLMGKKQPWGDKWNALEISRKRPDLFQWWGKECQRIAY